MTLEIIGSWNLFYSKLFLSIMLLELFVEASANKHLVGQNYLMANIGKWLYT